MNLYRLMCALILLYFVNSAFIPTAFSNVCPDDPGQITEGDPEFVSGTLVPEVPPLTTRELNGAITLFKYYTENVPELTSSQSETMDWAALTIGRAAAEVSKSEAAGATDSLTSGFRTILSGNGVEFGPSISEEIAKEAMAGSYQGYDLEARYALTKAMTELANAEVTEMFATGFKWGGRAVLVVGVVTSVVHVIYADDPVDAAVGEVSGWVTSYYFGSWSAAGGAAACAFAGPVGSAVCGAVAGVVGGMVGFAVGSYLGRSVWYTITHPSACNTWHFNSDCGPLPLYAHYAVIPPVAHIFSWVASEVAVHVSGNHP